MTISKSVSLKTIDKIHISMPFSRIAEIRLRAGRSAVLTDICGNMEVCSPPFTGGEIADVFNEICGYSLYSHQSEIAEGYVTLQGGHRVGICGTAVYKDGKIDFIKDISGLNIRIAHEIPGCAEKLYKQVFSEGLTSLLIVGKPLSGKTTLLRDLARLLSVKYRVCIIDSRNEISACCRGTPGFDIGLNTDVLCGFGKAEGIMTALRTLSPEIIICDEIGDDGDVFRQCSYCGVKITASAHSGSLEELHRRFDENILSCFEQTVLLGDGCGITADNLRGCGM